MADYQAPSWARAPNDGHTWTLVEIKNGTEIAQHAISNKACVTLGRASDMVDIELAHESCSRRHARVAFDSRGVPWLRDLGSTHGTTVNKKALPAAAIGKLESVSTKKGSRGVVLFPGDLLQFGGSTRLICLEGPVQFGRGAMKALEQQQHVELQEAKAPIHEPQDDEPEDSRPKTLDDSSIPPQHQKAWESLKARRYKQQNLETESQRIEAKGELTAGQERQLERNRQRLSSLQEGIDEIEQELLNKIYPSVKAVGPKGLFSAAVDEDDVDDRTSDNRRKHTNEPETEQTLVAKWKYDHTEYIKHNASIFKAESRVHALRAKLNTGRDDEDAFFLQNELDLAQDVHIKANQRLEEVLYELKESEKLLQIVNDKIITDLQTGYIGTKAMSPPPTSKVMPPPSFSMPPPPPAFESKKMPPPPPPSLSSNMLPPQPNCAIMPPPSPTDGTGNGGDLKPKAKRARVVGPTMPPTAMPPPVMRTQPVMPPPAMPPPAMPPSATGKSKRNPANTKPVIGTLSFLSSAARASSGSNHQTAAQDQKKVKPALGFDGKKDEWRAPINQDGSGRTKLNEKFAGKY